MNALRFRKRLDAPIPQLPELTPLVGKTVDIIVLEEPDGVVRTEPQQPVASLEQLKCLELGEALEGFDEAVDEWRRQPWRGGDAT